MKRLYFVLLCAFLLPTLAIATDVLPSESASLKAENATATPSPASASFVASNVPSTPYTYEIQVIQNKGNRVLETKVVTLKMGEETDVSQMKDVEYQSASTMTTTPINSVIKTKNGSPVPSFNQIKQENPKLADSAIQKYGEPDNQGNFVKTDNTLSSFKVGTRVRLIQGPSHEMLADIHESKVDQMQSFSAPSDEGSPTAPVQIISLPTVSASNRASVLVFASHEHQVLKLKDYTLKIVAKD